MVIRFQNKNRLLILIVFVLVVNFFSCSKKDQDNNPVNGTCTGFDAPYASNDGPVRAGETLHLSASSNEQNITYQWTGPGNFTSDVQNPDIQNIAFNAGGTYYARVYNGTCLSNTSPTSVEVTAPCNIGENSGVFGSSSWNFNLAITCGINAFGYTVLASSIGGNLKIRFAPDHIPLLNKIYTVDDPLTASFDSTEVQLTIINSSGGVFSGQSGEVFVNNYQNLRVVFCNIPFKSGITGTTITGEAYITCQ